MASIEEIVGKVADQALQAEILAAFQSLRKDARDVRDSLHAANQDLQNKLRVSETTAMGVQSTLDNSLVFLRRELVNERGGKGIDEIATMCGCPVRGPSVGDYNGVELCELFVRHSKLLGRAPTPMGA